MSNGNLPNVGWKNSKDTGDLSCSCGSWMKHWVKNSGKPWPDVCSVTGCNGKAALGGHVINPNVTGVRIVPLCDSCNKLASTFSLKGGVTLPSSNKSLTCDK